MVDALKFGITDGTIRSDLDPNKTAPILWGQSTGLIQLVSLKGDHLEIYHGLKKDDLIGYAFELIKYSIQPNE